MTNKQKKVKMFAGLLEWYMNFETEKIIHCREPKLMYISETKKEVEEKIHPSINIKVIPIEVRYET